VFFADAANNQIPGFMIGSGANLQKIRVFPERLCGEEVDPMLLWIGPALVGIVFKLIREYEPSFSTRF
jgi:hypothetical protein